MQNLTGIIFEFKYEILRNFDAQRQNDVILMFWIAKDLKDRKRYHDAIMTSNCNLTLFYMGGGGGGGEQILPTFRLSSS